jgi:hypothetical protein
MAKNVDAVITQSRTESIQERGNRQEVYTGSNVQLVNWLARSNEYIAPWWSSFRDRQLREFWKTSDHLSGSVYTMTSKMTAIPNRVIARDTSVKRHVEQAEATTAVLNGTAEFGDGWVAFYSKFVEDLLTQDNGAFAEIIGAGEPSGPIISQPISVAHLDSWRCQRTGNSVYPVIYMDTDGKRYKLHYTRVMYTSQMTSPIAEMFGVGVCAVSRCVNIAQNLIDIVTYKMEKLGSRPHREIIITRGGLDPNDLHYALSLAEGKMDNIGLSRYSKVVIGGSATIPEADAKTIELSGLPDGFDEQTSIVYGMAAIALAFGVDARELFPAMAAGATRADALLQHLKQRGKGPGQILQTTEQLFNYKFLPPHLMFEFDFQDDAEDRQRAEIHKIRAEARVQDLSTGVISDRVLREMMFANADIDQRQFEEMEIESGRLPDGSDVLNLFYANQNNPASKYLDLGVADPLDIENNDIDKMIDVIQERRKETMTDMVNGSSESTFWAARTAKAALDKLETRYRNPEIWAMWEDVPVQANEIDPRLRTVDLTQPKAEENSRAENEKLRQSTDDAPE